MPIPAPDASTSAQQTLVAILPAPPGGDPQAGAGGNRERYRAVPLSLSNHGPRMGEGGRSDPLRAAFLCQLVADVLHSGQPVCLWVSGTSMLPSLWPGDQLWVEAVDPGSVQPGDVVVCADGGHLIAHRLHQRISKAKGPLLITQGDRLRHSDPPLAAEALLGRVVGVERPRRGVAGVPPYRGWRRMLGWLLRRSGRLTGWMLWLRSPATPTTPGEGAEPSSQSR